MIIGFTGTSEGMSDAQIRRVRQDLVISRDISEVHHGDCNGADEEFHYMIRELVPSAKIVIHPPIKWEKRAFCEGDEEREQKEYLERDRDIAQECELLIATPKEFKMIQRSGTWATIRYAKKCKTPVFIYLPDGMISVV